ncbi:zinc finger, C3HC4 type [Ancylostoma ceylanicum]|uniref:Zinc finger, C3HC4 type n=1 Tax=Ancylostoma ceylanicum TaxID=53326 RepID=A0A0D6LNI1_9BILA|nr:zinc finger, C3HC4 type [Ancylostoma ceylanicum]
MSFYQPLILRLEVKKGSRQISFSESSKLDIEQSPSTIERNRRRIMSGLKKRSPPTGASTRNDGTDDAPIAPTTTDKHVLHELPQQSTNFRGRRTYSEVVVESLDGDRCADVISCTSDAEVFPQSSRSSKAGDDRMGREVQCRMLCMIGVPSQITLREILLFIGGSIQTIERIKVIRDSTPNEYMIILKFKSHNDAVVFYEEFNGIQFNSLEPNQCRLLFVDRIECASEDEVTALCAGSSVSSEAGSSNHLTELPTCAVCLERMDDSVVSILCNHTFHAGCLEQWTDTTHFELTSHTFCLQVGGQRVWDYAGDNYVHRLIQSDTEGKVVEYQRGDPEAEADEKKDKLDGIKLEYTCLLTSQLESQRMYFEARLADMERAMNNMEKMAQAQIDDLETKLTQSSSECKSLKKQLQEVSAAKQANEKKCLQTTSKLNKVTSELKEEREMNEMLRSDQQLWKHKVDELEKKCATCEQQFSQRINELQEQVSDLMLHFDAQSKIQAQLDSAQVSKEVD